MDQRDPRMAPFDAVMWGVEGDPLLRSVIILVLMLDREPDTAEVTIRIDQMTRNNPKMRQIPLGNPLSPVTPRWQNAPSFDLAYHLRWQRLPKRGGGLANVLALAEQTCEQDFDQSRPLWEMTLVTGLAHSQAAVIVKLHHSITDGVGGIAMAASIFDLSSEASNQASPPPPSPTPKPRQIGFGERIRDAWDLETKAVKHRFATSAASGGDYTRRVVRDPFTTAVATTEWFQSARRILAPASKPMSDVMTGRSLLVAFSVVEVPLVDLKAAARATSGTLNDAFMAAVTGGIRRYHERRGSEIDAVRVNMPINVRRPGEKTDGNHWVPARFPIPINISDAKARMKQLHPILWQAKNEPALGLSDLVYRTLSSLPRPVTTAIAGNLMKCTDVAATNVPGPPIQLYLGGAKILSMVPFAPKGGAALNIGLMSYNGTAFIGINCDRSAIEDPDEFTDCFVTALNEVVSVGQSG